MASIMSISQPPVQQPKQACSFPYPRAGSPPGQKDNGFSHPDIPERGAGS